MDDQQARELIDLGDPYGDFMTIDEQSSDILGALLMTEDMFRPPIWLEEAHGEASASHASYDVKFIKGRLADAKHRSRPFRFCFAKRECVSVVNVVVCALMRAAHQAGTDTRWTEVCARRPHFRPCN